jgi:4-amino-4-deoxy-L-arabinose transferase-like glycosyltransferase
MPIIRDQIFVILIIALGFALRFCAVGYNLPYIYNLDEMQIIGPIMDNFFQGDLNPHWFEQPGSSLMYILFGAIGLYYNLGHSLGNFPTIASFLNSFLSDPTAVFLIGRTVVILFGTFSIWLVFLIARRCFNRPTALIASLFFAVSPMHITHSRIIRTDVTAAFFMLLAIVFLFRFLDTGKLYAIIISGLSVGIGSAAKYPSAAIMLPLLVLLLFYAPGKSDSKKAPSGNTAKGTNNYLRLIVLGAAFVVGFILSSPFTIIDYRQTLAELQFLRLHEPAGYPHIGILDKFSWYLHDVIRYAAGGIIIQLLALTGLIVTIISGKKKQYFLVSIILVIFLILFVINTRQPRYVIPLLPFISIFAGRGLYLGLKSLLGRWRYFSSILALAAILIALIPAIRAENNNRTIMLKDTRTICKEWVEGNIPPGSRIAYEAFCPQFDQQPKNNYQLVDMGWNRIVYQPIKYYLDRKVDYIVLHSRSRRWTIRNSRRWPEAAERYQELEEKTILIKTFPVGKNPGPALHIHQLIFPSPINPRGGAKK